jgi:DNA topoisomerase-1
MSDQEGSVPDAAVNVAAAEEAGLRYAHEGDPGIRRRRVGKGFGYVGVDGAVVRDKAALDRIRKLAIPPAYTDVWICPDPLGHIQATGRDAKGRKAIPLS